MKKVFDIILLVAAFALVACTSSDLDEQKSQVWTISGIGTLEDSTPQTRALSIGGTDDFGLFNVWMQGEKMAVVSNGNKIGTVTATPTSNPAVAKIGGTAEWAALGTFSVGDQLTYYSFGITADENMGYMSWEGQTGSIKNISQYHNFQKADVSVTQIDEDNKIIMVSGANFSQIGSLLHLRFMDTDGKLIKPEKLTITAANGKLITRMNFDGTVVTASSITVNTEVNAITTSSGTVYPGEYPYDVFVMVANEDQTTATSYTFEVEAAGVTYTGPTDALNAVLKNTKYYQVYRILEATGGSPTPPTPVVTPKNVFSVSASKKVVIAHGNLRTTDGGTTYSFHSSDCGAYFDYNHYSWNTTTRDLFQWPEIANSSNNPKTFAIDGYSWYTLTSDEWNYLFDSRTGCSSIGSTDNARFAKAKVDGMNGLIIFPDNYTHPSGVDVPVNINVKNQDFPASPDYDGEEWDMMANAGAVFLPAYGYYEKFDGTTIYADVEGDCGYYWTSTDTYGYNAIFVNFDSRGIQVAEVDYGNYVYFSVRLVRDYSE